MSNAGYALSLTLASLAALALSYSNSLGQQVSLTADSASQAAADKAKGLITVAGPVGTVLDVPALARSTVGRYGLNVDPSMLVAMAWIESAFKPDAFRWEPARLDASVGLMQTLKATARDMYNNGYRAFGAAPDYTDLRRPEISMYYGAAYVDWLKKWYARNRNGQPTEEWIVRAYNGGPGWDRASASSQANTANHWRKYQQAKGRFG